MRSFVQPAAVAAAALITFAYRFLAHTGFSNDNFVHLARAQAMLAGDWPIRDYMEEGAPLTVAASAAAQLLLGQTPAAELMLAAASFAVAAGATCWLTMRLTGSVSAGMLAAILQALARPRLYGHPKMLVYPLLVAFSWAYIRSPRLWRLTLLAGWVAVAFLLRHDHGVYSAIGAAVAVAVAHWRSGAAAVARRGMQLAALVVLFLLPYLVYVQRHTGILAYFQRGAAISATEGQRARTWPLPDAWRGWAVFRVDEPPRAYLAPLKIRWRAGLSDGDRRLHERNRSLLHAEHRGGTTWSYFVDPFATAARQALLVHPDVEDTDGVDPTTGRLREGPDLITALLGATGLPRLRHGPLVEWALSIRTATAVLFCTVALLPVLAVLVARHGSRGGVPVEHARVVVVLTALVLITGAGLVRDAVDHRVSDGYGAFPILLVWTIVTVARLPRRQWSRRMAAAAGALALGAAVAFTATIGGAGEALRVSHLAGGPRVWLLRAQNVYRSAAQWPWADQWPVGDGWRIARYVHDCTAPGDRLLVTFGSPEYYVFSRRPFAGGETLLVPVLRPPHTFETSVVDRLQDQSVPIVLTEMTAYEEFEAAYPGVASHIRQRYRQVGVFDRGPHRRVAVHVEADRVPTAIDEEFGWPCFAR